MLDFYLNEPIRTFYMTRVGRPEDKSKTLLCDMLVIGDHRAVGYSKYTNSTEVAVMLLNSVHTITEELDKDQVFVTIYHGSTEFFSLTDKPERATDLRKFLGELLNLVGSSQGT